MAKTPMSSAAAHEGHHITQPAEYVKILIALSVLMALTVWVAVSIQFGDIGPIKGVWLNNLVALGIAALKAYLVIWVFMGVKHSTKLTKLWVVAGFFVFAIMFFILADNWTRVNEPAPSWIDGKEGSALSRTPDAVNSEEMNPNRLNLRPRQ